MFVIYDAIEQIFVGLYLQNAEMLLFFTFFIFNLLR